MNQSIDEKSKKEMELSPIPKQGNLKKTSTSETFIKGKITLI
jgi:hypothetical protein